MSGTTLPETYFIDADFEEFEALADAVAGWDLDWQQLDRGRLDATLKQLGTRTALLSRVSFSRQFNQRGSTPPGMITVGLLGADADEVNWCGQSIDDRHLMVFRPGGEYESMSPAGFRASTLSFLESFLNSVAQRLQLPDVDRLVSGSHQVLECDPRQLSDLRQEIRGLFAGLDGSASSLQGIGLEGQIEESIAVRLVEILATSCQVRHPRSTAFRSRVVRRAQESVANLGDNPITVQRLCLMVGASERSLEYGFREQLGVTPKQYLQVVRLSGARREIRRLAQDGKIADVANRWGFWHLGQFARDYRRQFGELPSETRRR